MKSHTKGDFHVRFCGNAGGEIPLHDPIVLQSRATEQQCNFEAKKYIKNLKNLCDNYFRLFPVKKSKKIVSLQNLFNIELRNKKYKYE